MTPFIEAVLNFVIRFWSIMTPIFFVKQNCNAIVLTFGLYTRKRKPGLRFKVPLVEEYISHIVCTDTINQDQQCLVTKDGVNVEVGTIIKYHVVDIRAFLLEVSDAFSALQDITYAATRAYVSESTWKELYSTDDDSYITDLVIDSAKKWGIHIEQVTITDVTMADNQMLANAIEKALKHIVRKK